MGMGIGTVIGIPRGRYILRHPQYHGWTGDSRPWCSSIHARTSDSRPRCSSIHAWTGDFTPWCGHDDATAVACMRAYVAVYMWSTPCCMFQLIYTCADQGLENRIWCPEHTLLTAPKFLEYFCTNIRFSTPASSVLLGLAAKKYTCLCSIYTATWVRLK